MNDSSPSSHSESVVAFLGEDRVSWLQGQVTQDLNKLKEGDVAGFCLCKPTGQFLTAGRIRILNDRIEATVPTATVPAILQRVEEAVFIEDVSASVGNVETAKPTEAERLERGIPLWGIDMDEKTLPPEMGPHFEEEHISYSKGCYTGQEILMRIHSRGHTNRLWIGLVAEQDLAGGTIQAGGAEIGRVTSAAFSARLGFIAGAMLRAEAAKEGEMVDVITPTATVRAEVRQMPLLRPA